MHVTEKNKVNVRIAGKDYALKGVESEEYIQRVALYIDRKMNEIVRANNKLSTSMAAVLTAVNVADDFFKAFESESSLKVELKRITEELEILRIEKKKLEDENAVLSGSNTSLQLDLATRDAELREVRNSFNKATRQSK